MDRILGIETSCDDTAVALLELQGPEVRVQDELIAGQASDHAAYGGIVPEIAARRHVERLDLLIREILQKNSLCVADLSAIAVTAGPGLAGGLLAGLCTGKALAMAAGKPLLALNHLEGHALSPGLSEQLEYPYLLLLASGGHCLIATVIRPGDYSVMARTCDDSAGEAFDKVARLLGLGFPGGPEIEHTALSGNPEAIPLPHPLRGQLDMSFSGLKTAVSRIVQKQQPDQQKRADLCAGFQNAVCDILGSRARMAMLRFSEQYPDARRLVAAGGVAANKALRARLQIEAEKTGFAFHAPPLRWCTDNAAMIAYAGGLHLQSGRTSPLDTPVRVRWPLEEAGSAFSRPEHSGAG